MEKFDPAVKSHVAGLGVELVEVSVAMAHTGNTETTTTPGCQ